MMASASGAIIKSRLLDGLRWVPVGACATSAWVRGVLPSPVTAAGSASPAGRIHRRSLWIEEDVDQKQLPPSDFYDSTVEKYAQMPLEKLSLKQMLQVGRETRKEGQKLVESAQKVQLELPKRLARRLMDLQFLPYIVVTNPHIKRVYHAYYHAFNTLKDWPRVTTFQENSAFTDLLGQLVDKHTPMLDCLACGLRECMAKPMVGHQLVLDTFLDNMLRSRISRRVIAEQHINILQQRLGYVGVVCTDINLPEAVDFAAQRAQQVCRETYGVAPEVVLGGEMRESMAYIPNHLDYILYELLKNAMRAVVERHAAQTQLQVRVCFGHGDVTVRISDQGGGIADEDLEKVWKYGYSTTHNHRPDSLPWGPSGTTSGGWRSPGYVKEGLGGLPPAAASSGLQYRMAGLGFGLPLSRLYARYFGGDLRLVSMPGYGVDAYLNLKWLHESHWNEEEEDVPVSPILELAAAGDVGGPLAADSAA